MCQTESVGFDKFAARRMLANQVQQSFPCFSHTQPGHKLGSFGNQDRMGIRVTEKGIILAVADGCSGSWNSAVGASLLLNWGLSAAENILRARSGIVSPETFAAMIHDRVVANLQRDLAEYSEDPSKWRHRLHKTFAATIGMWVITPNWAAAMGAGDSFFFFNGEKVKTNSQRRDYPHYLMYVLDSTAPSEMKGVRFQVYEEFKTDKVESLMVTTDGAEPLLNLNGGELLRRPRVEKQFVTHSCTPRCNCDESGRCLELENMWKDTFEPLRPQLHDDFTCVVVQHDLSRPFPPFWQAFRDGDVKAVEKALKAQITTHNSAASSAVECQAVSGNGQGFGLKAKLPTRETLLSTEISPWVKWLSWLFWLCWLLPWL